MFVHSVENISHHVKTVLARAFFDSTKMLISNSRNNFLIHRDSSENMSHTKAYILRIHMVIKVGNGEHRHIVNMCHVSDARFSKNVQKKTYNVVIH